MVKAKFKIGSIHGRVNYAKEEKVFHISDVPARAKAARHEIQSTLTEIRRAAKGLDAHPPWDPACQNGVANNARGRSSWDSTSDLKPCVKDGDPSRYSGVQSTNYVQKSNLERIQRQSLLNGSRCGHRYQVADDRHLSLSVMHESRPGVAPKIHDQEWSVSSALTPRPRLDKYPTSTLDRVAQSADRISLRQAEVVHLKELRLAKARATQEYVLPIPDIERDYTAAALKKYLDTTPVVNDKNNSVVFQIRTEPVLQHGSIYHTIVYYHPGKFAVPLIGMAAGSGQDVTMTMIGTEKDAVWSCCANGSQQSRGCKRDFRNPKRWVYDSPP